MNRIWAVLVFVIALAFALPAMVHAFMLIVPALLVGVLFVAIGTFLFRRRRFW